jgi:hypothetical protein
MIMVCSSMAELIIQYKVIGIAFKSLFQQGCEGINNYIEKRGKTNKFFSKHANFERSGDIVEDPTRPEDQVKDWMWGLGLIVTIVVAMLIFHFQWVR